MAELNLDYYQNTDSYSDGDVEERLLAYVKGELEAEALFGVDDVYAALYHLSPLRENILNWYPFASGARVLEVGSGCGALTRMLCRSAKEVVSVELSKRRASINYERNKDCENLRIMVGNLNNMQLGADFDYIVVNGVLEYAMSFTKGEKPYERFIAGLCGRLKPDGHMLIAIENRLGLKYFNGAPEDHTGNYFEGLDRYPENKSVRTFSRAELSGLLSTCGLSAQRFYYPYPDYKFPTEIFTDETIDTLGYGRPCVNLEMRRAWLFEENSVWRSLAKEKISAQFANSFLVDASQKVWDEPIRKQYVKLNGDRAEAFRIATSIEMHGDTRVVVKTPLTEAACAHLQTMEKNAPLTPNDRFENLRGTPTENGGVCYPFLTGETLDARVQALIAVRDKDALLRLLHEIFDEYGKDAVVREDYQTPRFREVFGPKVLNMALPCVCPANIDLICDNIFLQDDKYCIIDCEWIFDMAVPMPFIIWRCINELYTNHRSLASLISRKRLLLAFEIDDEMADAFWEWATYFAKTYVASSTLEAHARPVQRFSLNDLMRERLGRDLLDCSLYYDMGTGFSEEQQIRKRVRLRKGCFRVTFDLSALDGVSALRWDPLEGCFCSCRILRIEGADAVPANASIQEKDGDIFLTTDPIYLLTLNPGADRIVIEGVLHKFDAQEQADSISGRLQENASLQDTLRRQQQEITRLRAQTAVTEAARRQAEEETQTLKKEHGVLVDALDELRTEYDAARQELDGIHASRSWRLLNKLRGNS